MVVDVIFSGAVGLILIFCFVSHFIKFKSTQKMKIIHLIIWVCVCVCVRVHVCVCTVYCLLSPLLFRFDYIPNSNLVSDRSSEHVWK